MSLHVFYSNENTSAVELQSQLSPSSREELGTCQLLSAAPSTEPESNPASGEREKCLGCVLGAGLNTGRLPELWDPWEGAAVEFRLALLQESQQAGEGKWNQMLRV